MKQTIFVQLFVLLCLVDQVIQLTPLMSNMYSGDISTSDLLYFKKVDCHSWNSVISALPMKKYATTEVTIKLICGNVFMIGVGPKHKDLLSHQFWGLMPDTYSYYTASGERHTRGNSIDYGTVAAVGDLIKMRVDLHEDQQYVEFFRNGHSMGKAFGGLLDIEDIYFGMSIHYPEHSFKIVDYVVTN